MSTRRRVAAAAAAADEMVCSPSDQQRQADILSAILAAFDEQHHGPLSSTERQSLESEVTVALGSRTLHHYTIDQGLAKFAVHVHAMQSTSPTLSQLHDLLELIVQLMASVRPATDNP